MSERIAVPLIIFFLLLWMIWIGVIVWLVIVKDGWRLLAKHYRTNQPAVGQVWRFQQGLVGWISYRRYLILTTNGDGLFLEIYWFVRFGRPRLFIPWSDFYNATPNTFLFWRNVKAEIGNPAITTVRLPPAIFEGTEGRKVLANPQPVS